MAKKKGKKNQKPADWTSPPPSPKAVAEEPPAITETLPLSPATATTETTQNESAQTLSPLTQPKLDDIPVEVPTTQAPSQDSILAKDPAHVDPQITNTPPKEQVHTEPPPDIQPPTDSEPPKAEKTPPSEVTKPISLPLTAEPPVSSDTASSEPTIKAPVSREPEPAKSVDTAPPPVPAEHKEEPIPTSEPTPNPAPELLNIPPAPSAPEPETKKSALQPVVEPDIAPVAEAITTASPIQSPKPLPIEQTINHSASAAPQSPTAASPAPTVRSVQSSQSSKDPSRIRSPPKPDALKQAIEDSRPPAPTPPVTKSRLRHTSPFEDDDEDDDLALIQPRLRGEPLSRDSSRGFTYPPQTSHNRGVFASRVPAEHYSNPAPPPPPPPGYHPRYYPPAAPQYYPNHAHSMSQPGGYPNSSPYGPPSHTSSPHQEPWNQFPPAYPPYGNPYGQRHDSVGSREYPIGPRGLENSSAIEDDTSDIFSRIAQAIPDLHVLLAKYKETHGQLGVREELLRRADLEQQERLKAKDEEIHHLKERSSNLEDKHSGEANRLRLEIGNMEEQVKELREQAAETQKFKKEAEETRLALEDAKASWETKHKDLEALNTGLEKTVAEEKEKAQKDFEEWRTTATTKHDAEKIALAIQFDKKLKEADVIAENQRQEAAATFIKEKDELRSEHQRQQRERDASFDLVRKELETKLSTAQKDREEALKHERESREVWEAERETLTKAHQQDCDSLERGFEEQRQVLESQYKKQKDESDKAWIELHAETSKKAEEEKAKVDKLTKELEELQKKFDELKAESGKEKEIIKSVAGNLENERARLEKLMECYGDIAEIKSKGDTYYLVSFSQLQKQIMDLATTHFVHLPVTPPRDVLEKIPPDLPSFLGDTIASRQLRSAYVAHLVSAMVTFRVFGPFLFSLGRRYDKADSLFLSMSSHIRDKSTRKEAIWRQQTLLAAFTSSGAKQRINTTAGTVVDEIVAEVKHFADPKEEEGIKIGVRRIVKLAAETWRFARLEREMISAHMPAIHDEKHEFTGLDYWPAFKAEDTPIASLAGTSAPVDERPKLLLRLFPVIHREPKHENFRESDDERADEGCVYHYGLALYDDAKCVEIRQEELRAAGLPPASNTSPTAADFPPPMIPPPRNPPPPTPDVGETTSMKSPTSPTPPAPSTVPDESPNPLPDPSVKSPTPSVKSPTPSVKSPTPSVKSLAPSVKPLAPSAKSPAPSIKSPAPSVKSLAPSVKSLTPSVESSKSVHSTSTAKSFKTPYVRPIPGPIDFSTPMDAPPPSESNISAETPPPPPPPIPSDDPPPPPPSNLPPPPPPSDSPPPAPSDVHPLPAPTESAVIPPSQPTQPSSVPPPLPGPTESAIIPPSLPRMVPVAEPSDQINDTQPVDQSLPTPPRSRAQSPLFEAEGEIEALRPHRSRNTSSSRRSTPSKRSNEELRKERGETTRRTSGYALSTKSSQDDKSIRTEKSDRSDRTDRSSSSRYTCESRSAAIKGLYPNSPLAGVPVTPPVPVRRTSLRKETRTIMSAAGSWDTNSQSQEAAVANADPSTHT